MFLKNVIPFFPVLNAQSCSLALSIWMQSAENHVLKHVTEGS
uniref:Uncharacterized protein n=1 Tax=Anguilla anguilla TaxID=7936 RepID=A0A0E9US44_ANGAN